MNEDILRQLINKGFKVVDFVDVKTGKQVQEKVLLKKETTETLLFKLCINPTTAALSGEEEKLFVTGMLQLNDEQNKKKSNDKEIPVVMKYKVVKASG